jgi:raffinose/stachyose/melibiose transport system permease protein
MNKAKNTILSATGLVWAAIVLAPFFLVVINAAKTSAEIVISPISLPSSFSQFLTNLNNVINNQNFSFWTSFGASLLITLVTLVLLILFSSMAAWVLVRNKTWWSTLIFMMFVASMVIPFQVVMLPLLSVFRSLQSATGIKFLQSFGGLIFAYLGFGGAMSIFILHGFVKGIPLELEEAASIDGCTKAGIFFRTIFPLLQPVQVTVLILNGIWIWNDFLLPSLMLGLNGRTKTLPVAVTAFVGSFVKQWDLILAAAFLAMVPIIILFIFAQKYIIGGMVQGAIK